MLRASGRVAPGYRVASGTGGDARFPDGTIALQLPLFRRAVHDFDSHLGRPAFVGTINIDFVGRAVALRQPEIRLVAVVWTRVFPPENFLLSRCALVHAGRQYPAFVYAPDPATKPGHVQRPSIVEVLSAFIPGLDYGVEVSLIYSAAALAIKNVE